MNLITVIIFIVSVVFANPSWAHSLGFSTTAHTLPTSEVASLSIDDGTQLDTPTTGSTIISLASDGTSSDDVTMESGRSTVAATSHFSIEVDNGTIRDATMIRITRDADITQDDSATDAGMATAEDSVSENNEDDVTTTSLNCISRADLESNLIATSDVPSTHFEREILLSDQPYSCPAQIQMDGPLADRAICPWYYTGTVDYTRVPSFIAQAKCKCNEREGSLTIQGRDTNTDCHPVGIRMPVLRLKSGRANNSTCLTLNDYFFDQEEVTVSCVALPTLT